MLAGIGEAVYLCAPQYEGETTTQWKKRRRARRDFLRSKMGGLDDVSADAVWDVWDRRLRGMSAYEIPTGYRADKSAKVRSHHGAVKMSPELPAGIRQLLKKGTLTSAEGHLVARFRREYELAYYSAPSMTTRYEERVSGSGSGGVAQARAAVRDARARMGLARSQMSPRCWQVLTQMVCFDVAQVTVGESVTRYKGQAAYRHAAGILLIEALDAIKTIYGVDGLSLIHI